MAETDTLDFSFLTPYLKTSPPTEGTEIPVDIEPVKEPDVTAAESAISQADKIKLLLEAGDDVEGKPFIYRMYPPQLGEGWGFLGTSLERGTRTDLFPKAVEKLLGPKYLQKLESLYGAPEISVPRKDASWLDRNIMTPLIGRTPTEDEARAERIASERGGAANFFDRYMQEKLGIDPTRAAIMGRPPKGVSPAAAELYKRFKYKPATDVYSQKVELERYGRVPVKDPEAFKEVTKRANEAIRWLAELPLGRTPDGKEISVAEDIIGEILLTDINAKYGTADKRYTLEDLDLKMQDTAVGRRLTFIHPDGEGRQPLDPVTFDWSDVLDQLPGAYVILGDVIGSIGGGGLGALTPVPGATFIGATAGGALGAVVSKFMVMKEALRQGEFTYDHEKGGWVSVKGGDEKIIPISNLIDSLTTEAMWSAGGAVLGSTIFRLGKAILTRGGSEAEQFINKSDWDDAYRRFGENKFGKKFSEEGIPTSPAYILESASRELREAAENAVGKERDKLLKRAARMDASASQLRQMEKEVLPEAAVTRERMLGSLEEGTRTIDGKVVAPAKYDDPAEFGELVAAAIRSGDGTRINNLLDSMTVANRQLMEEWEQVFKGTGEGTEAVFGQNIKLAAQKVLGTEGGVSASRATTGIYGSLNALRGVAGVGRRKAWNLQKISDQVDKDIRLIGKEFKGGAGAYPSEIQGTLLRLRDAAAGKDGISVNYTQVRQLATVIDDAIGNASGETQRRLFRLQEMLKKEEGRGFKNINLDHYKKWKTAQDQLTTFHTIWRKQFEQGLTVLNTDQLANKFLKSMNNDVTVSEVLKNFKDLGLYGREQEDLLRNVLKTRLRHALTREIGEREGVEIAGKTRTVKIGDQRFATETISGSKFNQFQNEYGPWIRQLFPNDPKLEKFADKIARSETLTGRYDKIARMERNLKDLPFLKEFSATDLQKFAIDEPHKLYDLVWQSGRSSVENTKSIKELNRILKRGLEADEFAVAQQRLKALTLKKIWDPDAEFAAASGKQLSARNVTESSVEFLNRERSALIEVFGESHFDNLRSLFREMNAAANPREMGIAGVLAREVEKQGTLAKIPGLIAKVWVGVLNRKARALNLGTKFAKAQDERSFTHLLSDSKALDRALKIRASKPGRITANALGSVLFGKEEGYLREDEIQELLNNFTITDSKGNLQPVPVQTAEEGQAEAVDRLLTGYK